MHFQVSRAGIPRVELGNLGLFDTTGAEIARLNSVSARFSLSALLRGGVKPETMQLNGAEIVLRRRLDGQFALSLGGGGDAINSLPGLLDLLDAGFAQPSLDHLSALKARALTISIEDARSGQLWQVTDGQIDVQRADTGLDISLAFEVFNGTEDLAEVVIGIETQAQNSQVRIGTSFKNAAAKDIAAQSPALSFLSVLDAPISGAMRADFNGQGSLNSLAGTLSIGAGALQPQTAAPPLEFQSAKTYFAFDPTEQKLEFSEVTFGSDGVNLTANGHAYLQEFTNGWPGALVGQFQLTQFESHPLDFYDTPIQLAGGAADFRLRLDPFRVDVGQMVLRGGADRLVASGAFVPDETGWAFGGDLVVDRMDRDRLLELWPKSIVPKTRKWLAEHLINGEIRNVRMAMRSGAEKATARLISWEFADTTLRYIKSQPPIENTSGFATIDGNRMSLTVDQGVIVPPIGGPIDMAGSLILIPDISTPPAQAQLRLQGQSEIRSILSTLNLAPFHVLRNASFGADVAMGNASFSAEINFPLIKNLQVQDVIYSVQADLHGVTSDRLIPDRQLAAQSLVFRADNAGMEIAGPLTLGDVAADIVWQQKTGPEHKGKSQVSGTVELSQKFVDEFDIGFSRGTVGGQGTGQFEIELETGADPRFTLASDLNRLSLSVPQVGWSKPRNATGTLWVAGHLGPQPGVTALELQVSGLNATGGRVNFAENGAMRSARFERVRLSGWLDAPVQFQARPGRSLAISTRGGVLDVRKTTFGGGGGANGNTTTAGGSIELQLDRVIVSEGISLTQFAGNFTTATGLAGDFTARLNGNTPFNGTLTPSRHGTSVRIKSGDGGAMLRDAGIVEFAKGGDFNLTLIPRQGSGLYSGRLKIANTKVKDAPGLTDLLSAISIVGLLDQMDGDGISFDDLSAEFLLSPQQVNLQRSSAVGPSLGVSLSGIYDLVNSRMDMEGVISPVYFLNAIGEIFTRKGEGLFGFTFSLSGASATPKVKVNPLSILTPGAFREIFRAKPPEATQ